MRFIVQSGWMKYLTFAFLAASGLAAGHYFSRHSEAIAPASTKNGAHETKVVCFPLTPADANDRTEAPTLAVDGAGRVYLSWASQTGPDERTLFITRSDAGAFLPPREVVKSRIFKIPARMAEKTVIRESKMTPHLAVHGDMIHLAWTEALPDNSGLRMVIASSTDQGATFGRPAPVHSGAGARPTYSAFAAGPSGELLCSWLDNRNGVQQAYASVRRAARQTFEPEQVVHGGEGDRGVCPCCPTASLIGPDGSCYVAFRNIANGFRDIAIGRKKPGHTAFDLFPAVPPTWTINGCPHDGPSLAMVGDTLHVAWMDAHTGPQRCYYGFAKLGEMKFSTQELCPSAGTQGNPKLCADAAGTLHAVWEESAGTDQGHDSHKHATSPKPGTGGREILHATLPRGAKSFGGARAAAPKAGAFQSRPSVHVTREGRVVIAFNELDEKGKAIVLTTFTPERTTPVEEAILRAAGFIDMRGTEPPPLMVVTAAGKTVKLADLHGKLVLLHFWGSECVHCLKEMPALRDLEKTHRGHLIVLNIASDASDAAVAQKTLDQVVPGILSYSEPTGLGLGRFEANVLPTVWLIDPSGKAIGRASGAKDWQSEPVQKLIRRFVPSPDL